MRAEFSLLFVCLLALFVQNSLGKWDDLSFSSSGQKIRLSEGFGTISGGKLEITINISDNSHSHSKESQTTSDTIEEQTKEIKTQENWFYLVIFTENQHRNIIYYRSDDPCIQESYYVKTKPHKYKK